MKIFKNKVVIVTGASSGIGEACAREFALNGAKVVLAARNTERLHDVKVSLDKTSAETFIVQTDVQKVEDCERLIQKTIEQYGRLDILVINAGISMRAVFDELDISIVKEVMDTNFFGAVYCSKFALPHLLKQKGLIIGVSSISGLTPLPGRTAYVASKHALDGFLNTLRIENMKKGLKVMVVHPGFTASNIRSLALNAEGEPQKETPRNEDKMMTSEKVASLIVKASIKGERNLTFTWKGKLAVWLYNRFPSLADRLIYHEMSKETDAPF
ncbi:MAG: short chain dehydrogenase [Bacteroidetes bacterium]|nr:MAG: short chain dehydrogenase [Bacteroidota bacterium]